VGEGSAADRLSGDANGASHARALSRKTCIGGANRRLAVSVQRRLDPKRTPDCFVEQQLGREQWIPAHGHVASRDRNALLRSEINRVEAALDNGGWDLLTGTGQAARLSFAGGTEQVACRLHLHAGYFVSARNRSRNFSVFGAGAAPLSADADPKRSGRSCRRMICRHPSPATRPDPCQHTGAEPRREKRQREPRNT